MRELEEGEAGARHACENLTGKRSHSWGGETEAQRSHRPKVTVELKAEAWLNPVNRLSGGLGKRGEKRGEGPRDAASGAGAAGLTW